MKNKRGKGFVKATELHIIYLCNWNGCFASLWFPRVNNNLNMFCKNHVTVVRQLSTKFLVSFPSSVHMFTHIIIDADLLNNCLKNMEFVCCTWRTLTGWLLGQFTFASCCRNLLFKMNGIALQSLRSRPNKNVTI